MANKLILAKLDTEELVIGEDDRGQFLKNCLCVEVEVDIEDPCKYGVSMIPLFDYLSDDLIDIDTDLIVYKTDKINPSVEEQYRTIVKKRIKDEKIKNQLININKNVKDRK